MVTVVLHPQVYLVTTPVMVNGEMSKFFQEHKDSTLDQQLIGTDQSSVIVETAARLCYDSFGKGRTDIHDFLNNLLDKKHGSVFEHINYGFLFINISRSCSLEIIRHRAGFSYSQRSQRFVDELPLKVVMPPEIMSSEEEVQETWLSSMVKTEKRYKTLLAMIDEEVEDPSWVNRRKRIRQSARSILPNCVATNIMVTGNVRSWRHFIEVRASPDADAEIRSLALEVYRKLSAVAPMMFADMAIVNDDYVDVKYSKI